MKREIITTDSYGRITIPSDTGNIWMNEMELVELFGVIAPTLRAAIRAVYKCRVFNPLEAENVSSCPTAIMRTCMPCRWWWHSLSALTRQVPQRFAMHCWKDCAAEKKNKSCWCQ